MEIPVHVPQENMGRAVYNAKLQDIGIPLPISVYAMHLSSGVDKNACALSPISCIKGDVQTAQMDTNGNKTDVKDVIAPSKTYKY